MLTSRPEQRAIAGHLAGTPKRPLTVATVAWIVPLLAGPLGWLWTGEWRWLPTGIVVALLMLIIGVAVTPPSPPDRRPD